MAWNTPLVWNAGRIVSPADLNTYISGNDSYLLNRPNQRIIRNNAGDYSTSSTTFVDIDSTNLSITLAMSGAAALITFTGQVHTSGGTAIFDITIDGVRYSSGNTQGSFVSSGGIATFCLLVTGLSAASHVFRPQWAVSAGTLTMYSAVANTPVIFAAQEVA